MKKYLLMSACFAAATDAGAAMESPADRLKREKAEKAEQERLDAEKQKLIDAAAAEEAALKKDAETLAAADAAKAAALNGPADGEGDGEEDPFPQARTDPNTAREEAVAAGKVLETIALSYPLTTPDEHTVFGFGGQRFTLGHLRALFNLKRSR